MSRAAQSFDYGTSVHKNPYLRRIFTAVLYEESDEQLPVPEFAKEFQRTVGELVAWLYE